MKKLVKRIMGRIIRGIGTTRLRKVMIALARQAALSFPADQGMRFLLWLDNEFYALQGEMAIRYGQGEHPKHRLMGYHQFFVENVPQESRVLDVGCGIGAVARDVAAKCGALVTGIDINSESIATAKRDYKHPGVHYQVGNVLTDLPNEKYDTVILSNVLEHLPDRIRFLERLVCVSGLSRLLVRVPIFERDWRVPLKRELGVDWRLDPTHEIEYAVTSFSEELSQAGLTVDSLRICWGEIWAVAHPDRGGKKG